MKRTPIKRQSDKVRYEIEPRYKALKAYIIEKRHVRGCEWCGKPGYGLDCHHVLRRSLGARIDEPHNLIFLCRYCHDKVQHNKDMVELLQERVKQLNIKYGIEEVWNGSNSCFML